MSAPARFTQADVKRAAAGILAAGLPVAKAIIHPNGQIEVLIGKPRTAHDNDEWADLE